MIGIRKTFAVARGVSTRDFERLAGEAEVHRSSSRSLLTDRIAASIYDVQKFQKAQNVATRRYNVSDNGVLCDDLIYIGFFRAGSGISAVWRIEKSTRARRTVKRPHLRPLLFVKQVCQGGSRQETPCIMDSVSRTVNTWSYIPSILCNLGKHSNSGVPQDRKNSIHIVQMRNKRDLQKNRRMYIILTIL